MNTQWNKETDMCEDKTDTDSDGNLMPIRMYKMFLPDTNKDELNKSIK